MLKKDKILKISKEVIKKTKLYDFLPKDKISTVYAAGSLLEGFGNSKSDIDLFVVANDIDVNSLCLEYPKANHNMSCIRRKMVSIFNVSYEQIDFDIEVYEESYINQYIRDLNNGNATSHDSRYDLLHRLKFGAPLMGEEKFLKIKEKIDYDQFNVLPSISVSLYYPVKSRDVLGAYEEKAYDTSFYMALRLLEDCIGAYLAIQCETNPNSKWLMKKISRYEEQGSRDVNLKKMLNNAYSKIDLFDSKELKKKTLLIMKDCQKLNELIEKNKEEVF
ncbi:hypothetical protein IA817_02575 [Listeria seeligeri]|uniref:hypothetical protein n=1 Tax=Listeria seeligeri TaxID=1640 RepID=UPI001627944B|nr:hypothetical protein [Listeria seeligeri]MBC1722338.1 hypothetical protein [Listeria seeligeri]MBF2345343.1 hypothetical protein [Listeria seeligeri]MBF2435865.1 hypothetical protein [Listeria seeligeri]MBF2480194.1 hypothetical protein [Listeria seeligeri]MBF2599312.1 hypothetical protein [Listeria seeligeri]